MSRFESDRVTFDPQAARQLKEHWRELDELNERVDSLRPRLLDLDEDALLLIAVMGRALHHLTRRHGCMTYMRLSGDYDNAKAAVHLMRRHPQNREGGNPYFRWLSVYGWWLIFDQPSGAYRMREGGWDGVRVEDYLDGLFAGNRRWSKAIDHLLEITGDDSDLHLYVPGAITLNGGKAF